MKKLIILSIVSALLLSCNSTYENKSIDIKKNKLNEITVVSKKQVPVNIYPDEMYVFKDKILLLNAKRSESSIPFSTINCNDLSVKNLPLQFGKDSNSIIDLNPYYFETENSSFKVFADFFYEENYTFEYDTLKLLNKKRITHGIVNDLLRLNDSIIAFKDLTQEKEFSVFNINSMKTEFCFREKPDCYISTDDEDDIREITQSSFVVDQQKEQIFEFFYFYPLIRVYNFKGEVISDIRIKGEDFPRGSRDDFYNGNAKIFFYNPKRIGSNIYVKYGNFQIKDGAPDSIDLQKWSFNGELIDRYKIPYAYERYAVDNANSFVYFIKEEERNNLIIKASLPNHKF